MIGQIAINVRDTERAVAFYRDVLGLRHLFTAGKLAFFDAGGVRLMLSPAESSEFDHPASLIYYRCDDVEAAHERMAGNGVELLTAPHVVHRTGDQELWMCFYRDPEGNPFAFMEERRTGM